MATSEHVVLLDPSGRATGTVPKAGAHHADTPLHLAFSCHVVDGAGRALLTQRAATKPTWPGVWSNACCGHPQLGESLRAAVRRRVEEELGVPVARLTLALPDFAYRAQMPDGTVEHELCPVFVAELAGEPRPDRAEVDDLSWLPWGEVVARAQTDPGSLSPWAVAQLARMDGRLDGTDSPVLDEPVEIGRRVLRAGPHAAPGLDAALAPVLGPVERVLTDHLGAKGSLAGLDPSLDALIGEVTGLVEAGGKRLRPAFVHWGHRATGAEPDPAVQFAGAAVELLHTFALLHDDVMDRSATRRGRPSAHATFTAAHLGAGHHGDPGWFGTSAAILAGDLADVWADDLLAAAPLAQAAAARARSVFAALREEVIAGQYLDLLVAADRTEDEGRVLRVAGLKSARYTVTRPLLLGAACAPERPPGLEAALTSYGDAVGLGFPLRDDVLGLFGDPTITGKSTIDDVREGKRTLLVLRALAMATPAQRRELESHLGDDDVDEVGADRVRSIVAETGAWASVEALIAERHAAALAAVTTVPEPAAGALAALADFAARRAT